MALQHDLRVRRHLERAADTLHNLGARAAQEARELVFAQRIGHRRDGAQHGRRVRTERDRERKGRSGMRETMIAEVERARQEGLVLRQTNVECRTSTCALLLIHATPQAAVNDLANSLGEALGLAEVDRAATLISLSNELGMAFAYIELILTSDRSR